MIWFNYWINVVLGVLIGFNVYTGVENHSAFAFACAAFLFCVWMPFAIATAILSFSDDSRREKS